MYFAGIDIGSVSTKMVLLDENDGIIDKREKRTKVNFNKVVSELLDESLAEHHIDRKEIQYIATTGLGRYSIPSRDFQITDLTAGAYGARFLFDKTKSVLDIGGQTSRAIKVEEDGRVKLFKVNDKCAAGSGSFITKAAKYLEVKVEEVGKLSLYSQNPTTTSSICAVLAESEIINQITEGHKVEDILRGIHNSLTDRAIALLKTVGIEEQIAFIGGVAVQEGMVASLQERLGLKVNVPDEPQFVSALGAALLGKKRHHKLSTTAQA
jgi:predicted CoA-substrate-specific enzyme activase